MCGTLVARKATEYSRILAIPDYFVELLFWVEDKRFALHFGVDPIAVGRAIAFNLLRRSVRQGASTITQQVYTIRVSRFCRISRSFPYKLKQIGWALCASAAMDRVSILNEYLSTIYWGRSYHGLDEAANGYFNTKRGFLSVAQSFFLAERLASPNRVSVRRILNLLQRLPIKSALSQNGVHLFDIVKLYEDIYGCGGEMWQLREK